MGPTWATKVEIGMVSCAQNARGAGGSAHLGEVNRLKSEFSETFSSVYVRF